MLTECAVAWSRTPICSAIAMNRFPKISSITGSTAVPAAPPATRAPPAPRSATRSSRRCPWPVTVARQPGSTTVVAPSSTRIAGPSALSPGRASSRRYNGARCHPSAQYIGTSASGTRPAPPGSGRSSGSASPVASTVTDSAMIGLPGSRNENCRR